MNPAARALVVTARHDSLSVQRAFKAGARGYVVAEDETSEVLHALEQVAAGELYASGTVARELLQMLATGSVETRRDACGQLSDRELQVFRLIGRAGTSRRARIAVEREDHRDPSSANQTKARLTNGTELTRAPPMMDAARNRRFNGRDASAHAPRRIDASRLAAAAANLCATGAFAQNPPPLPNDARPAVPVDALIPWLPRDDAPWHGIPSAEMMFDATGKNVIAIASRGRV